MGNVCLLYTSSAGKSLKERTKYFGIELNNHHNALEDAKACAQIVIETIKRCRNKSFENFLNVYSSIEAKEFKDLKPQISFGERNRYKRFNEKISVSEIDVYKRQAHTLCRPLVPTPLHHSLILSLYKY